MSNITTTAPMSAKVTIGQALVFTKLKSETKLTKLSKLLDGPSKKEDLKKISESVKLSQHFSTLLELSQPIFPAQELSEVLSLSELKEVTKPTLWPSKITSLMLPETEDQDSKDTLNKEVMLNEPLLT